MKRVTLIKNRSDEARKHLMILKNEAMKRLTLHCLASSPHRFIAVNTIYIHAKITLKLGKTLGNTYVKAKKTMFFSFATASTKITNFWENCQWNSSLHHILCVNIFFSLKRSGNDGKFRKR
jgi:hypothetical protein